MLGFSCMFIPLWFEGADSRTFSGSDTGRMAHRKAMSLGPHNMGLGGVQTFPTPSLLVPKRGFQGEFKGARAQDPKSDPSHHGAPPRPPCLNTEPSWPSQAPVGCVLGV